MSKVLQFRGYAASVEFDAEDDVFVGHIAGIKDVVGFHADTVADLKEAFHEAVDDYLTACTKSGKTPDKPYSGKVMFRISPEVHAQAAISATLEGKSLNQWGEEALAEKAARHPATRHV
jgi:predicted HicB family RNase H-like nuclease